MRDLLFFCRTCVSDFFYMKALSNGAIAKDYAKEKAQEFFKSKDVKITVDMKTGKYSATAWTSDFSKEYVAINSEYST